MALSGKADTLRKVVELARQSNLLKGIDENTILEGLQQREALGSTGFTNGIAKPFILELSSLDCVTGN